MTQTKKSQRRIINGENLPYRYLMEQIARAFGKRPPSLQIGKSVQRLYSWWDALQARLTGQPHIVTSDTVRLAGSHTFYDNSKGVEALSFQYRPISQTIRESCALFQQYQDLDAEIPILPLSS
jgi:nucleoside-diphosphate-sugar epimerase